MESLRRKVGAHLIWMQPKWGTRTYELRADDEVVARLEFVKAFGSLARAITADGTWTLKRTGFLKPRVNLRVEGYDVDIATFDASWSGGRLSTMDGRAFHWAQRSFWGAKWAFESATGEPLLLYESNTFGFKPGARMEVLPAGEDEPFLPAMAMLGWYLLCLMAQDAATMSAT